jgi:DNA polymerase-3 subunit gamma/tau
VEFAMQQPNSSPSLNLARKWRSAQFQEIVGQELVVRILQNSLFKNQFFPVYLLSGQRGCGKTSTARVFAAALNCLKLAEFQKNAQTPIPCLQCQSCTAMISHQHPDFIEIDAASYTGVDNIRNIIDTSSFLPLLGQRKIYLIDEVHMLSKAAFNAFLKILEEPPKFVVFILATTEASKLPDTVRSRCFQLFFNPIQSNIVVQHLQNVCQKESIRYEVDGLEMIAQVTQGSLRDAINLLEQARFAAAIVNKTNVLAVLGYPEDELLCTMLEHILSKNTFELMNFFASWSNRIIAIDYVIKRSIEMLYDLLSIKFGSHLKHALSLQEQLQLLAEKTSVSELIVCFDQLCGMDLVLAKTSKKQLLFETLAVKLSLRAHHEHIHDEKKK